MANWQVLDIGREDIPKLLVKSRIHDAGYQIELTDLSRIWQESLSKSEIIQRASESSSSIDPAQDDEQFNIFVGKIQSALNLDAGTSLDLGVGGDDGDLSIRTAAKLPRPLPPFKWTVHLRLQDSGQLENKLITPLLVESSRLHNQIRQLVDELHDKDRVISKICDRLETSGNDLTTVFPGVSNIKTSRKKGQREQLAKHVRGLADFDEQRWREQCSKQSKATELRSSEMNAVLSGLSSPGSTSTNANGYIDKNWWENLESPPGTHGKTTVSYEEYREQNVTNDTGGHYDETMQDDDFQKQATPPHLKQSDSPHNQDGNKTDSVAADGNGKEMKNHGIQNEDESTTDEDDDDLDAAPRNPGTPRDQKKAPAQHEEKISSPSPKKLGIIGGRSFQPSASPAPVESTSEITTTAPNAKPKLGAIGGKAVSVGEGQMNGQQTQVSSSKPSKMGAIRGKKEKETSPAKVSTEAPAVEETEAEVVPRKPRSPVKEASPPPRETSQERADKKRDQLKRELEEKAKAPVKKKRKF